MTIKTLNHFIIKLKINLMLNLGYGEYFSIFNIITNAFNLLRIILVWTMDTGASLEKQWVV